MVRRRGALNVFGLAGVLVPLLCSCGGKDRPPVLEALDLCADVPQARLPGTTSEFEQTTCHRNVVGHLTQEGTVFVPAGPGSDDTISIAIARVFSTAPNPKADPIVYLDGGPGGESLSSITWLQEVMEEMSPDRDFIFVDQRGIGRSVPDLQCTETNDDFLEGVEDCYERLSADVDLNQFNTVNNAADIDAIRRALGYEKWNLLGISYGTRLGLTVMRDYPEGVRSVLIDSVVPLHRDVLAEIGINGYRAMERAFDACAADPDCSEAYPDPMEQLLRVVPALNEEPGAGWVTGDFFTRMVFEFLYSPYGVGAVPSLINDADNGDFEIFENLTSRGTSGGGLSFGMHLSLHCAEEVPFSSREDYEALDEPVPAELRPALSGVDYVDWCERWPVDPAPPEENEPVESGLPTLVMAGEFDPITPPAFAVAAQEFLTNSTYVLVRNESHGASFSDCGVEIAHEFFDDPNSPVSTSCADTVPDIEFLSVRRPASTGPAVADAIEFITGSLTEADAERLKEDLRRRLR